MVLLLCGILSRRTSNDDRALAVLRVVDEHAAAWSTRGRDYVVTYCEDLLLAHAGCFPRTPLRTMRRRLAGACKSALLLDGEAVPPDVREVLQACARRRR